MSIDLFSCFIEWCSFFNFMCFLHCVGARRSTHDRRQSKTSDWDDKTVFFHSLIHRHTRIGMEIRTMFYKEREKKSFFLLSVCCCLSRLLSNRRKTVVRRVRTKQDIEYTDSDGFIPIFFFFFFWFVEIMLRTLHSNSSILLQQQQQSTLSKIWTESKAFTKWIKKYWHTHETNY